MSQTVTPAQTMGIDPITFQVLNNAFSSIVESTSHSATIWTCLCERKLFRSVPPIMPPTPMLA